MATSSPASPDGLQLRAKPQISARLNRKAVFVLCGVLVAIVLFVMTNIANPDAGKAVASENKGRPKITSAATELTGSVSDNAPRMVAPPSQPEVPPLQPRSEPARPGQPGQQQPDNELAQALRADTALVKFTGGETPPPAAQAAASPSPPPPRKDRDSLDVGEPPANEPDLNRQAQKRDFLKSSAQPQGAPYRFARPSQPITEFEVKTGSVIPAVLITGINSDLPGQIVAQVSQNVFDTASGKHLLIPQGTKLYGQYDSNVAFGQERLMVTWSRLIYPNAASLDLGGMGGMDKQGQSGFADQVNNHVIRTFGAAILTSLFSAGIQASQPQAAANGTLTTQQVAAASLGQQMGQFGMAIASRHLRVQPTIEIRRGHQFNVMVSQDLVFNEPYEDAH
jgi:type IV secretion system protein VirB10